MAIAKIKQTAKTHCRTDARQFGIGSGWMARMIIAAVSMADGAEPAPPGARRGMPRRGIEPTSPVSAAISPSIES
jgi:hypothetical protein